MDTISASSTQPASLVNVSAKTILDLRLGFNGKGSPHFGDFRATLGYVVSQLQTLRFSGTPCFADVDIVIDCQTIVNGDWYSAESACDFAASQLRGVLAADSLVGKMTVDAKACRVSCVFNRPCKDTDFGWLHNIGLRLLSLYCAAFFDQVVKIYPKPVPAPGLEGSASAT